MISWLGTEKINVPCCDANDEMEMYTYDECTNDSEENVKRCRGIVCKKGTYELICPSFGYVDEYIADEEQQERILNRLGDDDWTMYYSVEGTIVRLFWYNGQWYLCTHKKLDAFKSRWSCKYTFGELCVKALAEIYGEAFTWDSFLSELDTNHKYVFLIRANHENRIVCHAHHVKSGERIWCLGSYDEQFRFYLYTTHPSHNCLSEKVKGPTPIPNISSNNILEYIHQISPFEYRGLFLSRIVSDGVYERISIFHPEYKKWEAVRGNNPNLRFRFLEVRRNLELVQQLYILYPKSAEIFDRYENILFNVASMINHFYVQRYIRHKYVTLPKEEYFIMKKCHDWYLQDQTHHRIFTKKVLEFINEENPLHLYKMIRRYELSDYHQPQKVYHRQESIYPHSLQKVKSCF